jgi:hypothetical protein
MKELNDASLSRLSWQARLRLKILKKQERMDIQGKSRDMIFFTHRVQTIGLVLAAVSGAALLLLKYVAALETGAHYAGYALAAFLLLSALSAEKTEGEVMATIRKSACSLTLLVLFGGAAGFTALLVMGKVLSSIGLVDPDWVDLFLFAAAKSLSLVRRSLAGFFLLYLVILKVKIIRFNETGKI